MTRQKKTFQNSNHSGPTNYKLIFFLFPKRPQNPKTMFIDTLHTPSAKTVVSTLTAVAATAVIVRSVLRDYVPPELQHYVVSKLRAFIVRSLSSRLTVVVHEFDDDQGLARNDLFRAAKIYLKPTLAPETTRFRATLPKKETNFAITMDRSQEIVDFFDGVKLTWKLVSSKSEERKWLELSFHGKHRDMVLEKYLSHVVERSKEVREETKTLKLFTLKHGGVRIIRPRSMRRSPWESVILDHPATFGTLAMEPEAKRALVEDLERFVARRGFYRRVGRAWKRGYLLFGPPGTGKTSLAAAIANYLKFDVYDLELTSVRSNAELRKLVISMGNRSVLVVEDVDCAAEFTRVREVGANSGNLRLANRRRSEVTLSGLLNFIDGLWSSCGDERIIVLTTNHKDRLDPALLRPGRMDVHIHLTYCTPCGFRILASNYLGVTEHELFSEIEQLVETTKVTPAEIGEELLKNEEPDTSLSGLIEFLKRKKEMKL